jgi:hypothetical protein
MVLFNIFTIGIFNLLFRQAMPYRLLLCDANINSMSTVTSASSDVNLIGADVPSARQQADYHPPKSRLRAFGEFC